MMRSLEFRLLASAGVGSTAVLTVSGLVLYWLLRTALVAEFDASLTADAHTLAALIDTAGGLVETEMADRELPSLERSKRPDYYQLWRQDGKVIERSRRLSPHDLTRIAGPLGEPQFRAFTLPDGRSGRIVGLTFLPRLDIEEEDDAAAERAGLQPPASSRVAAGSPGQSALEPLVLALGRDTLDLDRTLGRLRWLLLGVMGPAVGFSLLTAAPAVRLGLRPMRTTAARIATIDSRSLDARLDDAAAPQEVKSVIDCLNGLLDRMADTLERERAFSANVAHELRTPLAGLRSLLEVSLSRPREAAQYQRTLEECLAISHQTQAVVENLLALARIDAGKCGVQLRDVSLDTMLREAWRPFAERAESRRLRVNWDVADDVRSSTDADKLTLILHNLFDNAVTYTDEGGTIEITDHPSARGSTLAVANSGSRLSPEQIQRVFERFWRGDPSRAQTGQHAGLGLSLCQELARLLKATLTASSTEGTFMVQIALPATKA